MPGARAGLSNNRFHWRATPNSPAQHSCRRRGRASGYARRFRGGAPASRGSGKTGAPSCGLPPALLPWGQTARNVCRAPVSAQGETREPPGLGVHHSLPLRRERRCRYSSVPSQSGGGQKPWPPGPCSYACVGPHAGPPSSRAAASQAARSAHHLRTHRRSHTHRSVTGEQRSHPGSLSEGMRSPSSQRSVAQRAMEGWNVEGSKVRSKEGRDVRVSRKRLSYSWERLTAPVARCVYGRYVSIS